MVFAIHPHEVFHVSSFISFSLGWFYSLPPLQYYEFLSIVLQVPCLLDLIPWIPSWITVLSLWWWSSCNSMKLWAMPCRTTQDGPVIVETSDKTWSTGEGNTNHSSILTENSTNCIDRQNDTHIHNKKFSFLPTIAPHHKKSSSCVVSTDRAAIIYIFSWSHPKLNIYELYKIKILYIFS